MSDLNAGLWYGRLEANEAAASQSANAEEGAHHHFPFARRLKLEWSRQPDGTWVAGGEDARRFEVICAECGDTDGPRENQSKAVQALRGPYRLAQHAKRVAERHFEEN